MSATKQPRTISIADNVEEVQGNSSRPPRAPSESPERLLQAPPAKRNVGDERYPYKTRSDDSAIELSRALRFCAVLGGSLRRRRSSLKN
jgi:hypothetical protein